MAPAVEEKYPTSHSVHAVEAVWLVSEPAGHFAHADDLFPDAYVPALHAVQEGFPRVDAKNPGSHAVHADAPETVDEYVPTGQSVQTVEALPLENDPYTQALQKEAASVSE